MLKPRTFGLLTACAALLLSCVAEAATVARVVGTVLVSKGDGFAPIIGATELASGGRVLVQPGSVAMITYPGDCVVRVGTGVWHVQPAAPCAKGTHELDFTGRMNDGGPIVPPLPPPAGYAATFDPGIVLGAGVVGFGLGIVCLADWCEHHGKPASP